jgi:nicotinamide-nucleotide amidase
MLGARLTAVSGASDCFLGGIIAYENTVKIEHLGVRAASLAGHGAVSDAVALEMAAGVRSAMKARVGIGITGVAGPGGGTDAKPVGTVSMAVDVDGHTTAVTRRLIGDRDEIRRRATQTALDMVRTHRFFGVRA